MEIPDEVVERVRQMLQKIPATYQGVKIINEILAILPAPAARPLPCPFPGCWGQPSTNDYGLAHGPAPYWVACPNCKAEGPNRTTPAAAIAAWNAAPRRQDGGP